MHIEFPKEHFESANLHVTLRPEYAQSTTAVKLLIQFDDSKARLVGHEIDGNGLFSTYIPELGLYTLTPEDVATTFTAREHFRQLMRSAFADFKYKELGIGDRNADKFFPTSELQVTFTEYAGRPIFMISEET